MNKENYYKKIIEKMVFENPDKILVEFLKTLKNLFLDYLNKEVKEELVSNLTVFWYATHNKFSDQLILLNPKIKKLALAMDITDPDIKPEEKRKIIEELIKEVNNILERGLKS